MPELVVLDASALMAMLRGERGAERVIETLPFSVVGTVNAAEVQSKLVLAGLDPDVAWWHISETRCPQVAFDEDQARIAGGLAAETKRLGLSLGDRACLALAMQRKAKVLTADRAWKELSLGIEIEAIR